MDCFPKKTDRPSLIKIAKIKMPKNLSKSTKSNLYVKIEPKIDQND